MGNYNQGGNNRGGRGGYGGGGNRGGGRGFGGGRDRGRSGGGFGGGRDRGRVEMHKAICSDCGVNCEVPFKPSNDKPVLCSDCFKGGDRQGGRDRGRDRGRGRDNRDRGGDRQMHEAICAECGEHCTIPFKPTGDKPVLCSSCFGGNGPTKPSLSEEKFEELNNKLDKVLKILELMSPKKVHVIKKEDIPTDDADEKEEKPAKKKAATKKKTAAKKKAPAKKKTNTKKKAATKKK